MFQSMTYRPAARTALLVTWLAASAQGATPGDFDPTFGTNGRTVVADDSKAIGLRLPDGSLLVASRLTGAAADSPNVVDLRRFDSEGHPDQHFGTGGVARHEFSDLTDLMQSVVRAPDGRVYLGGWTRRVRDSRGWLDMAVFAVDEQGLAVETFGDGGLAAYDLSNPDNAGAYDSARALVITPDDRLLAAAFSASSTYSDELEYDRAPQLALLNRDGSLDSTVDLRQFNGHTSVCAGISGLLMRADGSLLVGDDSGIYAFLGDAALPSFGVDGSVQDEHWYPYEGCPGLRGFAATQSGELLTVSVVNLQDGQRGFVLRRLQDNGARFEGSAQTPPVPLARLVGDDARFAGLDISSVELSRPVYSATDDRVYLLFGFWWDDPASADDVGQGWAVARFMTDGALDTGWGDTGAVVLEKAETTYTGPPALLEALPDGRIVAMSANGVLTRLLGGQREGYGAINLQAGSHLAEDPAQVSLEVTRTGGSAGAVSVEYSTIEPAGESATAGEDFTAVSGRLDWADGDTSSREIVIPILEDTLGEGDEQFGLEIRSLSGGAVLLSSMALLVIDDDADTATVPPPPPPPEVSSGGGGATDGLTLGFLLALLVLSLARRRRAGDPAAPFQPAMLRTGGGNHLFLMNRRWAFRAARRNLCLRRVMGGSCTDRVGSCCRIARALHYRWSCWRP